MLFLKRQRSAALASPLGMRSLDQQLFQLIPPLPADARRSILMRIWELNLTEDEYHGLSQRYDSYFRHYEEQCKQLTYGGISTLTHEQVLGAIDLMKKGTKQECRDGLMSKLPPGLHGQEDEILNWAAMSLLLFDISRWADAQTLQTYLLSRFPVGKRTQENRRLPRSFQMKTLDQIAGIKPHWTSDLTEHLSMKHGDTEVALFHHATMLDLYKKSPINFIPHHVLDETRRSLALLLPLSTKDWFRNQAKKLHLDPAAISDEYLRADERDTDNFGHWSDRLVVLKETFDDHPPRGLAQFWRDDRNSVQWWTFWIALLVFIIAIIQCVEGALQVYKAYRPSPS